MIFSNLNYNCSNVYDQEKISRNKLKNHSVSKNCTDLSLFEYISSGLRYFENSLPSASSFKSFSRSSEQFFLPVGRSEQF